MLKKIDLVDITWKKIGSENLPNLIKLFSQNPDIDSDIFYEIQDEIWEEGVCKTSFFLTFPYMVEIAALQPYETAKDLWIYLGMMASTQQIYRELVSNDILILFDKALEFAEEMCINAIVTQKEISSNDALYLFSSLFSFSKHKFGYMAISCYKDDFIGTSLWKCEKNHINDVTIYDSGIVEYEKSDPQKTISKVDCDSLKYKFVTKNNNPWIKFSDIFDEFILNHKPSEPILSHLKLSKLIVQNGVISDMPMRFAFSLCGCLLLCNGNIDESNRILHGWDQVICPLCNSKGLFADYWYEFESNY